MKRQNGFTLVEILLTVVLIGALFAVTAVVMRQGLDAFTHVSSRGAARQDIRVAFEQFTRELRLVENENNQKLREIKSNSISFDGTQGNLITYILMGNTLERNQSPLLTGVTQLGLTGYDAANQPTVASSQVRRVRVVLSTLPQGEAAAMTFRTEVFFRNYMYEKFR